MKRVNEYFDPLEDLEPLNLATLGISWPADFIVTCYNCRYIVSVEEEIPGVLHYNLVFPREDYNYALTEFVKIKNDGKDFSVDILSINYDPESLLHTLEPLRISVKKIDENIDCEGTMGNDKNILQFSDFINILIDKTNLID